MYRTRDEVVNELIDASNLLRRMYGEPRGGNAAARDVQTKKCVTLYKELETMTSATEFAALCDAVSANVGMIRIKNRGY